MEQGSPLVRRFHVRQGIPRRAVASRGVGLVPAPVLRLEAAASVEEVVIGTLLRNSRRVFIRRGAVFCPAVVSETPLGFGSRLPVARSA